MRQVEAAVHRRRVDRLTDAAANLDARRAILPEEGGERADPRQLLVVHLRRAGGAAKVSRREARRYRRRRRDGAALTAVMVPSAGERIVTHAPCLSSGERGVAGSDAKAGGAKAESHSAETCV